MIRTRRQWLHAASVWAVSLSVLAGQKEFWGSKDPGSWSNEEKQVLLEHSPWTREGLARMEQKQSPSVGYNSKGQQSIDLPDTRPGMPGGVQSVPIGEPIPPVPKAGSGQQVQFRVLARWETAQPVRLAGGPEVPEMTGEFYVIRLRGLPLMPPPKIKPGEAAPPDPNEGILQAIKEGTRLERARKPPIPCARLFKGGGNASSEALLLFPRAADPITLADKVVTLESRFAAFHLTIKFPLKEMLYKGELAL